MKVYIGADHNGFDLKALLIEELTRAGYEMVDEGGTELNPEDDFPQFASRVATAVKGSEDAEARGILICGSGQGMCIAANRFKGIRASLVWNAEEARAARNDSDSNVLCLPANELKTEDAVKLARTWLATPFANAARFKRRIKMIDELS